MYRLWGNVSTSTGLAADYVALLTLHVENMTRQAFVTEDYVNMTFLGSDGPWGWAPLGGECTGSSSVPLDPDLFSGQAAFYVKTANACTQSSVDMGTFVSIVEWHECASDVHCSFDPIFNDYTQFAVEVDIPVDVTPTFSFSARVTVGAPTACCLNDLLSTSQLNWSMEAGAKTVSEPPPQTGWQRYWPVILAGIVGVGMATPTVFVKIPKYLKPNRTISYRPAGVQLLSILFIIAGSSFVLGAVGMLFTSLSPFTVVGGAVVGHPYWTLAIAIFSLTTGAGLWNAREWGREFCIVASALGVIASGFLAFLSGPLLLLFLGLVITGIYIISYMSKPQIKEFFGSAQNTSKHQSSDGNHEHPT